MGTGGCQAKSTMRRTKQVLSLLQRADFNLPGPFSFYSYLNHVATPVSCGEEIILTVVSMMWQVGITVITGETLLQTKVCHSNPLDKVDLVVMFCVGSHYVAAGKCYPYLFYTEII